MPVRYMQRWLEDKNTWFNPDTSQPCLCMNLRISLQWALNLLSVNDAIHHLRVEHNSSLCRIKMELGLASIYVQDVANTTSENLRVSNSIVPWATVSDHTYLPSWPSAYASDCRPCQWFQAIQPADYSRTSSYDCDRRFYPKGSCGGSETGWVQVAIFARLPRHHRRIN